jgi:hypothetical protein
MDQAPADVRVEHRRGPRRSRCPDPVQRLFWPSWVSTRSPDIDRPLLERWDDSLPARAAFYTGDTPPIHVQVDRRLAEFVMTQIESPANLDRWPDPSAKLVTLILTRCGLRVSSALALAFDCVVHDGQGAPYLRYFNTKMKREAAVPIDEELEAAIGGQQRTGRRPQRSTSRVSRSQSTRKAHWHKHNGQKPATACPHRPCPTATAACPCKRRVHTPTLA